MIEINNLTKFKINKKSFSQVAKIVLSGENRETESLSLAFVSKVEIKKLNQKFRKKNKPTDVLSFEEINEVVICPEVVKEKNEDIKKVFVHGVLHLLGYDHEKSEKDAELMEKKEEIYLEQIYAKR
jgi:probable rRNA maturation factor